MKKIIKIFIYFFQKKLYFEYIIKSVSILQGQLYFVCQKTQRGNVRPRER